MNSIVLSWSDMCEIFMACGKKVGEEKYSEDFDFIGFLSDVLSDSFYRIASDKEGLHSDKRSDRNQKERIDLTEGYNDPESIKISNKVYQIGSGKDDRLVLQVNLNNIKKFDEDRMWKYWVSEKMAEQFLDDNYFNIVAKNKSDYFSNYSYERSLKYVTCLEYLKVFFKKEWFR